MALDKLVDSTKLDACLDAEADAIRAKTGGSADIPFDFANNKGFADAIASIQTGGGGSSYELFRDLTLDEDVNTIRIDLTNDEAEYNAVYALVTSPPDSPTFPYVNVNATTGGSYLSSAALSRFIILPDPTNMQIGTVIGSGVDFNYPISYIYIRSFYSEKMFLAGTRIRLWGVTIEDQ